MLYQLLFWYMLVLCIVILLISTSLISTLSWKLYNKTKAEVNDTLIQLEKLNVEDYQSDWQIGIDNLLPSYGSTIYILVQTPDDKKYYSKGAQLLESAGEKWVGSNWIPNVLWLDDIGPFFRKDFSQNGYTFVVYDSMKMISSLIEDVIKVLMIITMITFIIGYVLIYFLSKKINLPIERMTKDVKKVKENMNTSFFISEPEKPQEIKEVAQSFNELLQLLGNKIEKEKQFVGDASHELRTPVSAIRGHISLIKRRGKLHPEIIPGSLQFIDSESKRLELLIEQLLKIAKLDNDLPETTRLNLSLVLQETINEYQPLIPQIVCTTFEENIYIRSNTMHIKQILLAIIENAKKYSRKNGEIQLKLERENELAKISVIDNGYGIPDNEKEKIFDRFYRIDSSRSNEISGTGLGLSIVRQLVILYEGTIEVQDTPGGGSTFIISFTLDKEKR